jgi:polyhydroxybutyrate depolymerase
MSTRDLPPVQPVRRDCVSATPWLSATAAAFALLMPMTCVACAVEQDCTVSSGEYRIRLPEAMVPGKPVGAVMYFHGWRGSASAVMRNKALEKVVGDLGLALIAPNGAGKTWSFPGSPRQHRDEFQFVGEVLDDVLARFAVDPHRVMAAGFSLGGSMVWNLACHMGGRFHGFAPIAGAFWEPLPSTCPSAMPRIIHVHGMADTVVPYGGREIRSEFRQGDVGRSINVWMAQGGCPAQGPSRSTIADSMSASSAAPAAKATMNTSATLDCGRRYACGTGLIELCIHPGGHSVRAEWVGQAWNRLQTLATGN